MCSLKVYHQYINIRKLSKNLFSLWNYIKKDNLFGDLSFFLSYKKLNGNLQNKLPPTWFQLGDFFGDTRDQPEHICKEKACIEFNTI